MTMTEKFEHVDVLEALGQIMELHTRHYKEDFDLDKELIRKLAVSDNPEEKCLLWMSRPCGTYCLWERDVYLEGSHENKVWMYYHEQTNDPILAYALRLDGIQDGKVIGTVCPLDYPAHVERVKQLTCPITQVSVTFEDGETAVIPYDSRRRQIHELSAKHGELKAMRCLPESERELAMILRRERFKRDHNAKAGSIQEHIDGLRKKTVRGKLKGTQAVSSPKRSPHKEVTER